ncbi:MAG: FmdB family zinc ribbon protein [Anaerolineae bacterium]
MPIYEYRCLECGEKFEKLVLSNSSDSKVECPACHSQRTEKVISLFSASLGRSASSAGAPSRSCGPT